MHEKVADKYHQLVSQVNRQHAVFKTTIVQVALHNRPVGSKWTKANNYETIKNAREN